ncbi:unnamed protein product [Prunus armeniaca]|uniref:Pentacotripeptide-repeat region of PRORP domain-containing protein n=1 Tax=Prunus armeniaca TaxID=36596 RepID=A0A6J5VPA6_PRUAR|nr:unnamed protein product [Prunus armeniaca]
MEMVIMEEVCQRRSSVPTNRQATITMKPHKLLNPQTLPSKLRPIFLTNHAPSSAPFSSLTHPENPTDPPPITRRSLLKTIQSSQWHFIKHLSPNLSPSLISEALFELQKSPQLVLEFISNVDFHRLDIQTRCLAIAIVARQSSPQTALELLKQVVGSGIATIREIFNPLALSRERLSVNSSIIFDLLLRACCEMKKADEAVDCFYLMVDKGFMPKTETCNDMLSLFLKLNPNGESVGFVC